MTHTASADAGQFIYSRPDFRDGRSCITGTGMVVPADDITEGMLDIPSSYFYASLTYYFASKGCIDADLAAEAALYDCLAARAELATPQ